MINVFKSKSSFGNVLVASANACLILVTFLLSLNFANKFSIVIDNGHIASTIFNNPTSRMLSDKSKFSPVSSLKERSSLQSEILKTHILSKVVSKKVAMSALPGKLNKDVVHENMIAKSSVMARLPSGPNGSIDGTEKILALAFTFNGNKIEKVSWANRFVPIEVSNDSAALASTGPIGPVLEKVVDPKPEIVTDNVRVQQSSSKLASISDEQVLSIQNEIQETIIEQDDLAAHANDLNLDNEKTDTSSIVEEIVVDDNVHDPFSDQLVSKTIGNAIERETERMGGAAKPIKSVVVNSSFKNNLNIQKKMGTQNVTSQLLNTQSRKSGNNFSPKSKESVKNSRSPGIVDEGDENGLIEDISKQQDNVMREGLVNFYGVEISKSGQAKIAIKEDSLSLASELVRDSMEYVSGHAFSTKIEEGSTFDLKIVDENYFDSTQEISNNEQVSEKEIYFIKRDLFQELLDELAIDPGLGHLLFTNDQVESVEIDSKDNFSSVVYLDSSLRETTDDLFKYVLISARPGNIVASVKFKTNEHRRKIFHLYGGELRIDSLDLIDRVESGINVYTQRIMGSRTDYNENNTVFSDFQSLTQLTRRGPNHIEYVDSMAFGSRSFLEVEEDKDRFYIGTQLNANTVILPSPEFRNEVLNVFSSEAIGKSCIIQVNLDQKVEEVEILSETGSGPVSYEATYLDRDGTFGVSVTTETTTMFIKGEDVGAFEIYLQTSGGFKVLRTYCSQSSYLVEQL